MWWKYYVLMYENGKMRPAKTISGMGVGVIKENNGGSEFFFNSSGIFLGLGSWLKC
jgi:hypothetical protein